MVATHWTRRVSHLQRRPRIIIVMPSAMATGDPTGVGASDGARPPGRRIVVVDDNLDAAEMLARSLELLGHQTWVAHDGAAGLALLREVCPDVALVDLGLPIMDGYELAEHIRREPALAALRLFALTGYSGDQERQRTRAAGFHEHLVKPVTLDRLDSLLRARS